MSLVTTNSQLVAIVDATPTTSPLIILPFLKSAPLDIVMAGPDLQPEADPNPFNNIDVPTIPPHANPATSLSTDPVTPSCMVSLHPQSTLIKIKSSTISPFTTNQKYCIKSHNAMGEEIKKYLVGPMPAYQFLDDFFPISKLPDLATIPQFEPKCYGQTIEEKKTPTDPL
jgi:hypothetical protein